MSTALQIIGDRVVSPAEFQDIKSDALMSATLIEFVNDPVSHDHAVSVQGDLQMCIRTIEKSRKELKAPIIAIGKLIDATAAKEALDLEKEQGRVQSMINDFQALELARARAAENARRLEEERIEAARQAELRRLQEIEDAKRREIAAAERVAMLLAQQARNEQERAAAVELQREIQRQKELADAESLEKLDAIHEQFNAASAALPPPEFQHRAEGQRVVESWDITVLDVWTLARAHSSCVKIEPVLSEIKKLLDLGVRVHGVSAQKKVSSTTTARRAIDV